MNGQGECSACGSASRLPGDLVGLYHVKFQVRGRSFWEQLRSRKIGLEALLCLDCGHVELRSRSEEARKHWKQVLGSEGR